MTTEERSDLVMSKCVSVIRAIKATVGVNIVGCYYKCTVMKKYKIIEAGPNNNCFLSETDRVGHSGGALFLTDTQTFHEVSILFRNSDTLIFQARVVTFPCSAPSLRW